MKVKVLMITVVFAALLVFGLTLAYANDYDSEGYEQQGEKFEQQLYGTGDGAYSITGGWLIYAIGSLMFILALAGGAYMLGKAFNIPQATVWAKTELLNLFGSFLILITALLILNAIFSVIMGSFLSGSSFCMDERYTGEETMDFALCKVQAQIITLENLWEQTNEANKPQEVIASTCYSFFGLTLWCGDWYGDLRQRIESAHYVGTKTVALLIPLHSEFVLLKYIAVNMLSVFLPLGIVLRCFSPTKGVGGLLIAMSIGLYFVFPALNFMIDPSHIKEPVMPGAFEQLTDYQCFKGFKNTVIMIDYESGADRAKQLAYTYENAADIITEITVTGLFYPMIAFAGAVMFIYTTAPFFGGEAMDLTRVIRKMV